MQTFNFLQEYILENDRVRLRPLHHKDLDLLLPFSEQEPEIWNYSLQPANGLENLKTYIDAAIFGRTQETAYPFLVFDKRT
ncbi:MAG: GNAT family N-acetyltransferase, partial [Aequorivita sp.]|nr:GNAT family N-acetyltransferase [Aequorivita sp.]